MPWACPMESHVGALVRVAQTVNVKLPGSSPWHLSKLTVNLLCSLNRETPWDEPMASAMTLAPQRKAVPSSHGIRFTVYAFSYDHAHKNHLRVGNPVRDQRSELF